MGVEGWRWTRVEADMNWTGVGFVLSGYAGVSLVELPKPLETVFRNRVAALSPE